MTVKKFGLPPCPHGCHHHGDGCITWCGECNPIVADLCETSMTPSKNGGGRESAECPMCPWTTTSEDINVATAMESHWVDDHDLTLAHAVGLSELFWGSRQKDDRIAKLFEELANAGAKMRSLAKAKNERIRALAASVERFRRLYIDEGAEKDALASKIAALQNKMSDLY